MSIQKKNDSGKDDKREVSFGSIGEGERHYASTLLLVLFILCGFSAFALGRLSVQNRESQRSVVVETVPPNFLQTTNDEKNLNDPERGGESVSSNGAPFLVGSKNSDKYHFPWCSGARRIKPDNQVSFSSYEEARKAGYSPASNCDGLQ